MDDFLSIGVGFAAEKEPIGEVVAESPDLINPVAESHDCVNQCIQCEDKFKKTLEPFDKKIDEQKEKYAAKCEIVNSCEPCQSDKEREDEISSECLREGTNPSHRLYSAEQYIIDQVMTSDLVNAQKNTVRAFANGINILGETIAKVAELNAGLTDLKDADIIFDKYSHPDSAVTVNVENSYLAHIPFEDIEDSILKIMDAATYVSRNTASTWISAISDLGDKINFYIDKYVPFWNVDIETGSLRLYENIDKAIGTVVPSASRAFERVFYNIENFAGDNRVDRNIREVVTDYDDIRNFVGFLNNLVVSFGSKKESLLAALKEESTGEVTDVSVDSNEKYMKVLTLIYNLFKCISGFVYTMIIDYESVIKVFKPMAQLASSENYKKKVIARKQ